VQKVGVRSVETRQRAGIRHDLRKHSSERIPHPRMQPDILWADISSLNGYESSGAEPIPDQAVEFSSKQHLSRAALIVLCRLCNPVQENHPALGLRVHNVDLVKPGVAAVDDPVAARGDDFRVSLKGFAKAAVLESKKEPSVQMPQLVRR
jgi:hypothetical protein